MARPGVRIRLTEAELAALRQWCRPQSSNHKTAERARIILLSHEGQTVEKIARMLRTRPARVSKWRQRFCQGGLLALADAPRSGKPRKYTAETELRVLAMLDQPAPEGYPRWTGSLLAAALKDVSTDQVWRILRKHGSQLQRRRSWIIPTDAEFRPRAAVLEGLYLNPPENTVVLVVDDLPHIEAPLPAPGSLRLPDRRTTKEFRNYHKRYGAMTLLTALEAAAGLASAGRYAQRRRRPLLDFLDEIVGKNCGKEIHILVDHFDTNKAEHQRWVQAHPDVHLHRAPTYSSWLHQVEFCFSILSHSASPAGDMSSARRLRDAIDAFVKVHGANAAPFEWSRKVAVQSATNGDTYSDLCK